MVSPGANILVTGASGYIGGRLVGELLDAGYRVRCLARTPAKLEAARWANSVEVVQGDIEGDLRGAVDGVDVVYYLIHSIGESSDWIEREAAGAANLRDAAASAGVQRIVYLGGLGSDDAEDQSLSSHLQSRHRVGEVLADGPVPVTELRAAVIIGSGSASFEMLRYLVEVLPVMVTPKWVDTRCQPIAVNDVLRYLVDVLACDETVGRVLDIGGPDVLTYREMMAIYAEEAGLRPRIILPVPVLSPRLSSHWVSLVTPLPRSLARPLVGSLVNEVIVKDDAILAMCKGVRLSYRESVRLALASTRAHDVTTRWSGADGESLAGPLPTDPEWSGGSVLLDERELLVHASPQSVYRVVSGIGGERGWYGSDWLWKIRGFLDTLLGGPGMRPGRRHPDELRVGDALDFWRVQTIIPDKLLRLRAEMRMPGVASLEWHIEPSPEGSPLGESRLRQIATFVPRGLWGRVYWYSVAPFHRFVFPGMIRHLAEAAERATTPTDSLFDP